MDIEQEKKIRQLVKAELERYGLNTKDPADTREILRWSKQHMETFESVGGWITRSIVLVVVGAFLLAVWEGIKHYVRRVTSQ